MDDVPWWAKGKSEQEVTRKPSETADAALDWQGRMASPSTKPRRRPCFWGKAHRIGSVGDYEVQFNQHAAKWLGIWNDHQETPFRENDFFLQIVG